MLTEYFRECKRSFSIKVKKYIDLKNNSPYLKVIKQFSNNFIEKEEKTGKIPESLVFRYIPDEKTMFDLIEKSLQLNFS